MESMHEEINVIVENKTWQLMSLPKGHKAIGVKFTKPSIKLMEALINTWLDWL